MPLLRVRSFQGRIFLAILAVVLIPAGLTVAGGVFTLRTIGTRSGTLGAWDAVAESGHELLDGVDATNPGDSALHRAAERHRQALSESVRMSRLYAFVAERFVQVLPWAALLAGLTIAALAFLTARRLSRGFGEPVAELARWTERIARHEPLPSESDRGIDVQELETLREALRKMAAQLEDGRRKAVETARLRSWTELARRVAHEIKNPLTPMRMAAATLARGREGPEAEAGRILIEELERLDEMARTFAQYGKVPEGPRSRVELGELLESLASQHRTEDMPIEVSARGPVWVEGHFDALERAFRNLVVNAAEAQCGNAGRIEIEIENREGRAVVSVSDRGPGIPMEMLDEVWHPDVTTKSRGTGLGLSIVRQTVTHHDGHVTVSNRSEGGARFEVELPAISPTGDTEGERLA